MPAVPPDTLIALLLGRHQFPVKSSAHYLAGESGKFLCLKVVSSPGDQLGCMPAGASESSRGVISAREPCSLPDANTCALVTCHPALNAEPHADIHRVISANLFHLSHSDNRSRDLPVGSL